MKVIIEIETEAEGMDAVTSALNGHKFRAILFEMVCNKRKQIVRWEFEDNDKFLQAEGAQRVFDVLAEEIAARGVAGLIDNDMA